MNKLLTAAVLIGLTGTALVAAPTAPAPEMDLSALPMELQTKIKNAQKAAESALNPITNYVANAKGTNAAFNRWIIGLPPLVQKDAKPLIDAMNAMLDRNSSPLQDLADVESLVPAIEGNFAVANQVSEYISATYVYPKGCQNQVSLGQPKGCIMPSLSNVNAYALYPTCNAHQKPIALISPDVGRFGHGTDFSIGKNIIENPNVPYLIKPYGPGGANVVVCVDLPTNN